MSLTVALDDLLTRPVVRTCGVGAWIDEQGEDTAAKIDEILASGKSRAELHRVLSTKGGLRLGLSAFSNHLSSRCPCTPKEAL